MSNHPILVALDAAAVSDALVSVLRQRGDGWLGER
jgi:hypothetical protein